MMSRHAAVAVSSRPSSSALTSSSPTPKPCCERRRIGAGSFRLALANVRRDPSLRVRDRIVQALHHYGPGLLVGLWIGPPVHTDAHIHAVPHGLTPDDLHRLASYA